MSTTTGAHAEETDGPQAGIVVARARGTLPALDSMRALAAIAVLATHAGFWGGAYGHRGYGTALARLDIGVAIFFVLSGFLLSRTWFEHHAHRAAAPPVGGYLWRRLLRILPVYLVAAVAALVLLPGNRDASAATVLHTLTLTSTFFEPRLPDGLTQMWSLGTEASFYLVLPLLMWWVLSRRRGGGPGRSRLGLALVLLVVLNVSWLVATATVLSPEGAMTTTWLPGFLTWFGVGMVFAASAVRLEAGAASAGSLRVATLLRQMGRSPGACWVSAGALFAVAATPVAGAASLTAPVAGEAVAKNLLYAACAGLVILPAIFADPAGRYIRVLSWPVLRHLGYLSYGVFCVHLVVLELVARWRDMPLFEGRTLELFTLTLVLSVAVAEVLYRCVERPAMRLRHLVGGPASSTRPMSSPSPASTSS